MPISLERVQETASDIPGRSGKKNQNSPFMRATVANGKMKNGEECDRCLCCAKLSQSSSSFVGIEGVKPRV
jgi:hypothetical protein